MNRKLSAALLTVAIAIAGAGTVFAHEEKDKAPPAGSITPSAQLDRIMMGGMKHDMKMSGDVDRDFAAMMIMHHQQAIDMADVEIKHGKHPELKAMAQKMKDQQKTEQEELKKHD